MSESLASSTVEPRILKRLNCPLQKIAELCKNFQVYELSLFGSALGDDFDQKNSDIDFLVVFKPDARLDLVQYYELEEKLADLVGRKVDLVSKNALRPHWRDEVVPASRVIYAA